MVSEESDEESETAAEQRRQLGLDSWAETCATLRIALNLHSEASLHCHNCRFEFLSLPLLLLRPLFPSHLRHPAATINPDRTTVEHRVLDDMHCELSELRRLSEASREEGGREQTSTDSDV